LPLQLTDSSIGFSNFFKIFLMIDNPEIMS
jgi:hypothetical protein